MSQLTPTFVTFTVHITRANDGYKATVIESPCGKGAIREFAAPLTKDDLAILRRYYDSQAVARGLDPAEVSLARKCGGALYEALFKDETRAALDDSLRFAQSNGEGLRINLDLSKASDLVNNPWELMYSAADGRWLAQSKLSPIVRYLELGEPADPPSVDLPLRVLCVASEPKNIRAKIDVPTEKGALVRALEPLQKEGMLALEFLPSARIGVLATHLATHPPYHVFHFIGHGTYDAGSDEGYLLFEDAEAYSDNVAGDMLTAALRDHGVRLAIINACEGARSSSLDQFAGIAQSLIRSGIPAVVAMLFKMVDDAAITFSKTLYTGLAEGLPIDSALVATRREIFFGGRALAWATPVLYTRSKSGVLFRIAPVESVQSSEATRKAEQQGLADEAARKVEHQLLADEAAHRAEQQRLADEAARKAEQQRQADKAARKAEQRRFADEAARKAEQQRLADEAVRKAEQQRLAEQTPKAQFFSLHVVEQPDGGYVVSDATGQEASFPVLLTNESTYQLSIRMAGNRMRRTRYYSTDDRKLVRSVGEGLFSALISGAVESSYRTHRDEVNSTRGVLRLTLDLTKSPSLLNYPWEFLYDPSEGDYVSATMDASFVRVFDVGHAQLTPKKVSTPLRVLVVSTKPPGLAELDIDAEVSGLKNAALNELAGLISIEHLSDPTLGELKRGLDARDWGYYDIIHFIGHGGFSGESKIGSLSFRSDSGQVDDVSPDRFSTVVRNRGIRLAIINACEGGRTEPGDPFASVAINLLRARFAAVIAMQFEISDSVARLFSRNLYERLAKEKPIDLAVAEARSQILADQETIEWATPALYVSSAQNTNLFDFESHELEGRPKDQWDFAEAAAKANERRRADEAAAKAEEQRRADEAAAKAEEQRHAAELANAEEQRQADQAAAKAAEERVAAKARLDERLAAGAKRLADRSTDEAKKLEDQRRATRVAEGQSLKLLDEATAIQNRIDKAAAGTQRVDDAAWKSPTGRSQSRGVKGPYFIVLGGAMIVIAILLLRNWFGSANVSATSVPTATSSPTLEQRVKAKGVVVIGGTSNGAPQRFNLVQNSANFSVRISLPGSFKVANKSVIGHLGTPNEITIVEKSADSQYIVAVVFRACAFLNSSTNGVQDWTSSKNGASIAVKFPYTVKATYQMPPQDFRFALSENPGVGPEWLCAFVYDNKNSYWPAY